MLRRLTLFSSILLSAGCAVSTERPHEDVATRAQAQGVAPSFCEPVQPLPACADGSVRKRGDILITDHNNGLVIGIDTTAGDPEFYLHSDELHGFNIPEHGDLMPAADNPNEQFVIGNTDESHIGVARLDACGQLITAEWANFGMQPNLLGILPRGMAQSPVTGELWVSYNDVDNLGTTQALYSVGASGGDVVESLAQGSPVFSWNRGASAFDGAGNLYQASSSSGEGFVKTAASELQTASPALLPFPLTGADAGSLGSVTDIIVLGDELIAVSGSDVFGVALSDGFVRLIASFGSFEFEGQFFDLALHAITLDAQGNAWLSVNGGGPSPGVVGLNLNDGQSLGAYFLPIGNFGPYVEDPTDPNLAFFNPWGISTLGENLPAVEAACDVGPSRSPLSAELEVFSEWSWGYCAHVVIENQGTEATEQWQAEVELGSGQIDTLWTADWSAAGTVLSAQNSAGAGTIQPGLDTRFGWCASKESTDAWQPTLLGVSD